MNNIKFQSYCWSVGTTSFRVKDLNFKIEKQLQLLNKLWKENSQDSWNGNNKIQEIYYNLMKESNFIKGQANNKPKDSREKTSGLVQVGVIDNGRKVTEVGNKILEMVENNNYKGDNIFNIDLDSFIYLKQLLKLQNTSNGLKVKPFIVLLYVLSEVKYLTKEEFTYILPLCRSNGEASEIVNYILEYREGRISIDDIIFRKMEQMSNYKAALKFMIESDIKSREDFSIIDMNRKGVKYVKSMYEFYVDFYKIIKEGLDEKGVERIAIFLREQSEKNSKVGMYWKKYFNYSSRTIFSEEYTKEIETLPIFKMKDKKSYNKEFFKIMHIAKWRSTLEDYADLNKRYFALSDIVIFEDNKVELELFPKYYFLNISNELLNTDILDNEEYEKFIGSDKELEEIYQCLNLDINKVLKQIEADYPNSKIKMNTIKTFIKDDRLKRFNKLIDVKFRENSLIYIFDCLEKNDKASIFEFAEWEADLPTIFEYILAITWYRISEKKGNILEFMKLSLDANLYPKSHAGGGTADIVYEYEENKIYPGHKILLEATLTESTSQRKNEMEPVSRHLFRELQESQNKSTYAIFVANILNEATLSDFRGRKNYQYRDSNGQIKKGLKIISLSIGDIIKVIQKRITYNSLYKVFDTAYYDEEINDIEWYEILIKNKINNL